MSESVSRGIKSYLSSLPFSTRACSGPSADQPSGGERKPDVSRRLTLLLIAGGLAAWAFAGPVGAASADCPGVFDHVQGKADSDSSTDNVQGVRNSINTQDLSSQCWTVRSSASLKDFSNYIEVGWIQGSYGVFPISQQPEVFVTRNLNGQPANVFFGGKTPAPGTDHEYKIANGGSDFDWHVEYNGAGVDTYATTFRHASRDLTNSERHQANDSLWDHHDNVQICTGSGDCDGRWHDAAAYHEAFDSAGDYDFCRDSIRESHVRPTC